MQDSYRDLFLTESQEYLTKISNCLVKLEEDSENQEAINEIFRCTHTLKGMSATMGFDKLAQLSHQMEDLLDEVRSHRKKLDSEIVDQLFVCLDTLGELLQDVRSNKDSQIDISVCINNLKKFLFGPEKEAEAIPLPKAVLEFDEKEQETITAARSAGLNVFKVEIILSKDCVMKEARSYLVLANIKKSGQIIKSFPPAEDLKAGRFDFSFILILSTKETKETVRQELFTVSEVEDVNISEEGMPVAEEVPLKEELVAKPAAVAIGSYIKKIQSIRIPVERADKIMNIMGELSIARIHLTQIVRTLKSDTLSELSFSIDQLISVLQDEIMQTRLLPVAYILDAFPRIVRDLARKEDKDVDLQISGSEIELDRIVLDEISEPLVHLVRNAIDHGIESAEERRATNKNVRGKIFINVTRQKGQIFLEVADDGKGIDFAAIAKTAVKRGLLSAEEAGLLDEKKALELMCAPGFSTALKVSEISGRGVGLDVVKTKIETLGGRLDFESKFGMGSRFILALPLTLAIIKAMLVKVENEIFAIPLMSIRETVKVAKKELKLLRNFEVVRIRDEIVPILRLNKELGLPVLVREEGMVEERIAIVIIEQMKTTIGLKVDQILGEQDIVVKPLDSMVKRNKGIAGATILGDGKVALILDTMSLR